MTLTHMQQWSVEGRRALKQGENTRNTSPVILVSITVKSVEALQKSLVTHMYNESHRTALLVFWPLKPAVLSDRSIPAWQGHKM